MKSIAKHISELTKLSTLEIDGVVGISRTCCIAANEFVSEAYHVACFVSTNPSQFLFMISKGEVFIDTVNKLLQVH